MEYQHLVPSFGGLVVHDLPQHLRRGTRLSELMSGFGWLLRTRPDSLPVAAQEKLHDRTVPASSLAFFISHCWASPGHEKYIALLLHRFAQWAILAGAVCSSLVVVVQRCWAPMPCIEVADKASGMTICYSPWEFAVCLVVGWAALLLGPHFARDRPGFFDATCIPQAPLGAKLEAIRHVPSFVAACDEFVIAWDPLYFTRGWCVYEIAVFKALFPDRRITVLPIKMYAIMLACQMCSAFVGTCMFLLLPISDDANLSVCVSTFLIGVIAAHAGEELDVQRRVCDQQLVGFDFRNAGVQIESDRVEMMKSISLLWSGGVEEFNLKVRSEIREEVLASLASCRAMLPYTFMVIAVYPMIGIGLSFLTTWSQFPVPMQVAEALSDVGWPFLFFPIIMALAMRLGACCAGAVAGPVPWRLRHLGIGAVFSAACALYELVSVVVPSRIASGRFFVPLPARLRWCGPLLSLAVFLATAAVAAFVFCPGGGRRALGTELRAGGARTGARIVMAL